jgi:divalent metal cation (Fe/Co/Zn/Cd) transporter
VAASERSSAAGAATLVALYSALRLRRTDRTVADSWLLALALIVLAASSIGVQFAECLFASLAAIVLAWQGWHLTHHVASDLLRYGRRARP